MSKRKRHGSCELKWNRTSSTHIQCFVPLIDKSGVRNRLGVAKFSIIIKLLSTRIQLDPCFVQLMLIATHSSENSRQQKSTPTWIFRQTWDTPSCHLLIYLCAYFGAWAVRLGFSNAATHVHNEGWIWVGFEYLQLVRDKAEKVCHFTSLCVYRLVLSNVVIRHQPHPERKLSQITHHIPLFVQASRQLSRPSSERRYHDLRCQSAIGLLSFHSLMLNLT